MKKMINPLLALGLMLLATSCASTKYAQNVEVVNNQMVVLKDVEKIEIQTTNPNKLTYIFELNSGRLVKAGQGSFHVYVNKGEYLIQTETKITKASYQREYAKE